MRELGARRGRLGLRGALTRLEGQQAAKAARQAAAETLKGFVAGIIDTIKAAKLAQLLAPVTAARDARAAAQFGAGKASLEGQISRGVAEAADPKVQARFARNAARLDARIAAARRAGNLEVADSLQSEKDALDARYGPQYLAGLRDSLAQLNEDETERTAEKIAEKFGEGFKGGLEKGLAAFLAGGSIKAFFDSIAKGLAGSGVTPGALPPELLAGVGEAAAIIGGTTRPGGVPLRGPTAGLLTPAQKHKRLKGHSKHPKHGKGRVSGGMLTPGMLTLVGETGPELIVGGKVNSATRTNRMGKLQGMSITVNATGAAANDPVILARELGWQLATR